MQVKKWGMGILTIIMGTSLGVGAAHAWSLNSRGYSPVPAYVHAYNGFSAETKQAISTACSQWNNAGAGNLVYQSSFEHSLTNSPVQNNSNDITRGFRGTPNYLMITSTLVNSTTNKIVEADLDINVSYPFANDGSSGNYDIGGNITHEIGHLLGLEHTTDTEATMYSSSQMGETKKRTIEQDDKNGILFLYK
ncbi:matrixin family metalloprotease [Tumebacillus permanentifrigoris]|uniref:Matrixin n=1 Tax=Tumebacillus permanentifrigoris TaxID=378543 RepID=A0A316D9Q6_9BACL|nr:matrixin family metalloprotease [Tumebacillus permanentifrigoris]PWK13078.1 matrixin [Tumebacillus permanentifrigoris]